MIFSINNLKNKCFEHSSAAEKVTAIACHFLEAKKAFSPDNAIDTSEITSEYKQLCNKSKNIVDIPENTIKTMLSILARDNDSVICCEGRKQGYYLDVALVQTKYSTTIKAERQKTTLKEKDLYPLISSWLSGRGFTSLDISGKHGGGTWRNPDVLGIKENCVLGQKSLEILTIEVKPSLDQWPIYVFEAVSHSMFANKAYFAFLRKKDDKIPDEILTYAHQYNIGLITITISDEKWEASLIHEVKIVTSDCEIQVIFPAQYHQCDPTAQNTFLNKIGKGEIADYESYKNYVEKLH